MQIHELKEQLVKKVVKPIYIFTGEEVGIMDIYIQKISDIMETPAKRVDSIATIYSKLQNNSFINKPNCYIIRDDKDYLNQEKIWAGINEGVTQGKNTIILIYTNLDKRGKFYKAHAEMLTHFDKLIPEVLAKYIKKEIGLDINKAVKMAELCDCDYSRILLECDKLTHLSRAMNLPIDHTYDMAVREKLVYTAPKDVIFEFIDAICKRQIPRSYKLLDELKALNESPLGVISLLYTNIRSMLLVQSAGTEDIANRTGLTAWQIKIAKEKGNNYSINELVKALRAIRETEKAIKTGTIEQAMALDYILASIL